jgi:short-subunit dehydrogenase
VTALCPGPTRPGFAERAALHESKLFRRGNVTAARTVAAVDYAGMRTGTATVLPGARNWMMAEAVRIAPRGATTSLVRGMRERAEGQ